MAADISFDDINSAFLGVEYLTFTADYAMWLHIAYEGKPDGALVDLVQEPKEQRSAAIERYLAAHRGELSVRWLRCTQCETIVSDLSETLCKSCHSQLQPEFVESEEDLRGRAWDPVMGSEPGVHARLFQTGPKESPKARRRSFHAAASLMARSPSGPRKLAVPVHLHTPPRHGRRHRSQTQMSR